MAYPEGLSIHTIWDEIVYFIDSTNDLLSLALTCRIFKNLVIPDHLEYRRIHCDIRAGYVWKLLESQPRLARGVRSLRVLDGNEYEKEQTILPRKALRMGDRLKHWGSRGEVTKENLVMFMKSLSHMTLLREFAWSQGFTSPQGIVDISHVLTNIANRLEALSMKLHGSNVGVNGKLQFQTLSIWALAGLKRVILYEPVPAAIHMILHRCPDIEDLCLLWPEIVILPDLMRHANWTKLRRLNVSIFTTTPSILTLKDNPAISTSFFDRHANLESLQLIGVPMPSLPSPYLPKLRFIEWSSIDALVTSFLSHDAISRLVHWGCSIEGLDTDNLPQMDKLETFHCFLGLNDVILPESFLWFLLKAPKLKKICLDIYNSRAFYEADTQEKMIQIFLQCPNLTHIFCDIPGAGEEKIGEFCQRLSVLPGLKVLELNPEGERLYVKFERDETGVYSGYCYIPVKEAERDPSSWGNFFVRL